MHIDINIYIITPVCVSTRVNIFICVTHKKRVYVVHGGNRSGGMAFYKIISNLDSDIAASAPLIPFTHASKAYCKILIHQDMCRYLVNYSKGTFI